MTTGLARISRFPPCGPVEGTALGATACFLGVPYAQPMTGEKRFLAPEPVSPWQDKRACLHYGPTAPQPDRDSTLIPEPQEAGEDYLNLNVFAPLDLSDDPLPVMVYVHGGGYWAGCNRSPWFEGDTFVRDGVILVSPSYRLNVEGFMPIEGAPDNRAILDWILALQWVRENIEAFGGDPSRVTLAGQSAGAGAVATLLACPQAKGLFQRAILFSGSLGFKGSRERAAAFAERFVRAVGRPATVDALATLSRQDEIAGYSQAVQDPEASGPGAHLLRNIRLGIPLQPIPGTDTLPATAASLMTDGAGSDIPVLITTTHDEFVFELEPLGAAITDDYLICIAETFDADLDALRHTHRGFDNARLLGQLATDTLMRAPMIRMANIRKRSGAAGTWTAEFRQPSAVSLKTPLRAAHCLDMPYYFDKLSLASARQVCGNDAPMKLATQMHRSIVEFVHGESPDWTSWHDEDRTRIWHADEAMTEATLRTALSYLSQNT